MQTIQFLHDAFAKALLTIHARRLKALMAVVAALLQGRCLGLTALGRFLPSSAWSCIEAAARGASRSCC